MIDDNWSRYNRPGLDGDKWLQQMGTNMIGYDLGLDAQVLPSKTLVDPLTFNLEGHPQERFADSHSSVLRGWDCLPAETLHRAGHKHKQNKTSDLCKRGKLSAGKGAAEEQGVVSSNGDQGHSACARCAGSWKQNPKL